MKKILQVVSLVAVAMIAAASMRLCVRRFAPGLYAAIWGGNGTASASLQGSGAKGAPVSPDAVAPGVALVTPSDRRPVGWDGPRAGDRNSAQFTAPPLLQQSTTPVRVTGYIARNGAATVFLSDGRILMESDLTEITRRYVVTAHGEKFFLAAPRSRSEAPLQEAKLPLPKPPHDEPTATPPRREIERDEGAWVRGADGVSRLKDSVRLGRSEQ